MENCAACGKNEMYISKGPHRFKTYRGQPGFLLPADLEFPVCRNCGAQWMNDQQLDALSDSLELQRIARLASVQVVRVHPEATLPEYKTSGAAGLDLHACLENVMTLDPGERCAISTGIAVAIPGGYEGQVRSRSGLAFRTGVTCLNSPGVIDSDYRGEIKVLLVNHGRLYTTIKPGDRIAQLVICPIMVARLVEVDRLNDTLRGTSDFTG